jgi:hypothetical protein
MSLGRPKGGAGWCLVLAAAVAGCNRADSTAAMVDETAVKEYQAILEKDIGIIEEEAGILKTVDASAVSRENARNQLVQLAAKKDAVDAELRAYQFKDLNTKVAVRNAAAARLAQRQKDAMTLLLKEIHRINQEVPGGREFFEKELRPALDALKGR